MILEQLVLNNVGTFAGRHVIELSPRSPSRPIILIGGLNGAGKTTILEAIQVALYGPRADVASRHGASYQTYLRGLIHHGSPPAEGASIELSFTAHQEGQERSFWLARSWSGTGSSTSETLVAKRDGREDQALAATWSEQVETFLPRGVAGLFFFDGEQIEALADLENSRQVLGSALSALLGLDLVERLSSDLAILRRRHKSSALSESARQAVTDLERRVVQARQAEGEAKQAVAARRNDAGRLGKALSDARDAYRKAGGDLADQRSKAQDEARASRIILRQREDDIRRELGGYAPLLQVMGLLADLEAQSELETEARRDALIEDAINARDESLLSTLRSQHVAVKTLQTVEQFVAADRERRASMARVEPISLLADPSRARTVAAELPDLERRLARLVKDRRTIQERLEQAEGVLSAIPDSSTLEPLHERLVELEGRQTEAQAQLAISEERHRAAMAEVVKVQGYLDKALDSAFAADDEARIVTHIDRARATLERLRVVATANHLGRISSLTMEALGMLLRKEHLITDLRIDPVTYTLSLTGLDGRPLPPTELSAGERQLLAVALLWGLARASGQPLPVVIDTPLGRLDSSHRHHLLERYFPQASHQVILLSTDTEIDEVAYTRIEQRIGRAYHLEFDPATNATDIIEGYFWRRS